MVPAMDGFIDIVSRETSKGDIDYLMIPGINRDPVDIAVRQIWQFWGGLVYPVQVGTVSVPFSVK